MIICSNCKSEILDDSKYCDQCGQLLMFCPNCADGKPRRGKRCTQCGTLLQSTDGLKTQQTPHNPHNAQSAPFGTGNISDNSNSSNSAQRGGTMRDTAPQYPVKPGEPSKLVMVGDPSKVVVIKPKGLIGRSTGDYVDVFGSCPYVSSTHGRFTLHSSGIWLYTDLGSTNGSKINGTTLVPNKNYHLTKDTILEIGNVKFNVI